MAKLQNSYLSGNFRANVFNQTSVRRFRRPIVFGLVGVLNTCIDFGIFALLYFGFGVQVLIANSIGYMAGILNSYVCNNRWTFGKTLQPKDAPRAFSIFLLINLIGLAIANFTLAILISTVGPVLAKGSAVIATFVWNYWSSRKFVFRKAPAA